MGIIKPNSFILPAATSATLGGVKADPATDKDITPCRIKNGKLYITPPDSGQTFVLKAATLTALGGIKAGPKTEDDTVVAHIGEDQQLYVPAPVVPNMPHVQVVSYVGTGTFGRDNPCSISVDFPIKFIAALGMYYNTYDPFIYNPSRYYARFNIATDKVPTVFTNDFGLTFDNSSTSANNFGKRSPEGKTYYWYSSAKSAAQLNEADVKYYFLVIG